MSRVPLHMYDGSGPSHTFSKHCASIPKHDKIIRKRQNEHPSPPDVEQKYELGRHDPIFHVRNVFRSRPGEPREKKPARTVALDSDGSPHGECKPFGEQDDGFPEESVASLQEDPHDILSTPGSDMYHQDLDEEEVVEEEIIVPPGSVDPSEQRQNDTYNEDIAFQNHINSGLLKLPDDEKVIMKFNIQKIIIDAKFGAGTARDIVSREVTLEVESYVELDPCHDADGVGPSDF